jgi:hypothetical protein
MNTNIKTKRGRVTRYGLACGYVETKIGARLEMISPSAGVIFVNNGIGGLLYSGRNITEARRVYDMVGRLPLRDDVERVTYHRPPTPGEIRFGMGATHYADFSPDECCYPNTRIPKNWFVWEQTGLRYYR